MKKPHACLKMEKLAEEYSTSTREYLEADKALGDFTGGNYKKLLNHSAWTRARANNAKQALNEHVDHHGC